MNKWINYEGVIWRNLKTRRGSPVDDRPSTDKLHHFVQKKKKVTCDTWHATRDTWHETRDMWHVTRLGGWTFSQHFSSLALSVCDLWSYEDILGKGWVTQLMTRLFVGQPRLHRVCQWFKKMDKKKKQGKCARVWYLKDGRRRQLDLQHFFRAGILLELLYCELCNEQGWE